MAIELVACGLDRHCHKGVLDDEVMAFMAEGMGVESSPGLAAFHGYQNVIGWG